MAALLLALMSSLLRHLYRTWTALDFAFHPPPKILHDSTSLEDFTQRKSKLLLIIANGKAKLPSFFETLWNRAELRLCADGGANLLHDSGVEGWRGRFLPDAIVGDLDSARADVLAFYESKGVSVIRIAEQETNDLAKCLNFFQRYKDENDGWQYYRVCVIGGVGGRFDHEMANINVMASFGVERAVLLSDSCSVAVLQRGIHVFSPNPLCALNLRHQGSDDFTRRVLRIDGITCGLVPFGRPVDVVSTTGLRWNLGGEKLEFGGLISTSNEIVGSEVTVQTSDRLLFSIDFKSLDT